jgi:hypothetical protein
MSKSVSGMRRDQRSVQDIDPDRQTNANEHSGGDGQPPRRSRDSRAATYGMWFIGLVILLLLFFLFSVVFAETTVTVTPRTAPVSVDSMFSALPSGSGTSSVNTLNYSVISVSDTTAQTASSSGSEYRESRASGEITIFNEYSDESVQLVPETRFEAPDGSIYRTQSSVTVPGQSSGSPGQITVPVVAAEAGSDYNLSGDIRFSVPGFVGTPQEGQVYAELNTPIDGGVAKEVPIVSTSTQQRVADAVRESLRTQLESQLSQQIPESMVIYDDSRFYTADTSLASTDQSTAEVSVTGTLEAVGFDQRALSIFLANENGIEATADTNLQVQDVEDFTFEITNRDAFTPNGDTPLEFRMAGESLVVWQYNKQALARDLQSLQRNQINAVLKNYESIQSATIDTRPFWKRSLPSNPEAIKITTELQPESE